MTTTTGLARITWNTLPNGGWRTVTVYAHEVEGLAADRRAEGCRVLIEEVK